MVETRAVYENEVFVGESLGAEELRILNDQVTRVLARDSVILERAFADNMLKIQSTLEVAKKELGGVFTGISAGDGEIGMSLIRSGHIKRTTATTETPDHDWAFAFAAGNDNWLGYSSANGTALNIDARIGAMLVLGLMFTQGGAPVVEDVQFQIGATTYAFEVIRHSWWGDGPDNVRFARLRPKLLKKKETLLVPSRATLAGQNELVVVGITFATGFFLRQSNPTTVQT